MLCKPWLSLSECMVLLSKLMVLNRKSMVLYCKTLVLLNESVFLDGGRAEAHPCVHTIIAWVFRRGFP